MSLINYTNIGTTAQQFAALKNQIRNGKLFQGTTSTAWTEGDATFTLSNSISDFENEIVKFRIKPDDAGSIWSDWIAAENNITVISATTVEVNGAVIPGVFVSYTLLIEVQVATGYIRLATAETWNQLNTAIKTPLSVANLSHSNIISNGLVSMRLGDLTGYASSDYIGIDEDTVLTFTVAVPQSGQASGASTSVSGLSVSSSSLSGNNYTINLSSGTATTSFTTYGVVDAPIVYNNLATTITVPKVVMNTTPVINNNTATFNASSAGYLDATTSGLVLNCYTGALEE